MTELFLHTSDEILRFVILRTQQSSKPTGISILLVHSISDKFCFSIKSGSGALRPEIAPGGTRSTSFAKGFFQASNLPEYKLLVRSFAGIISFLPGGSQKSAPSLWRVSSFVSCIFASNNKGFLVDMDSLCSSPLIKKIRVS